ncbi:ferredoxin family protein [Alphaproteobacteria bacterium]|nr:ferredoxin family protein [Alphaproteobacteria bacterium]
MTYVVTDKCVNCKYMDCVEGCPVGCFHEGENTLVIDPQTCIDCGVCEMECPVSAILPETAEGAEKWVEHNQKYATLWPQITQAGLSPADADAWKDTPNKMDFFSPNPGTSQKTS